MALTELRRIWQTPRTFSNWPRALATVVSGRALHRPAEVSFVTRTGPTIVCPNLPGAIMPIYEVFAEDCYRTKEFVGSAPVHRVLDIGAHIGSHALYLATLFPDATIDCFEPSPATSSYLARNVDANGYNARIAVHRYAMADVTGAAEYVDNGHGSGHNHLASQAGHGGALTTVPATTFDAVIAEHGPYELVKMDCEGAEYPIVLSSSPASWVGTTHLVMEFHDTGSHTFSELVDFLATAGLTLTEKESGLPEGPGLAWFRRNT